MNKKQEWLTQAITWLLIIAIFIIPMIGALLEEIDIQLPNDYARITDMEYKAVVVDEPGSQGKIVVTERITFDVHAASRSNGFWELWRDLCENYVDGVKVHYNVNSVKQIMPDGTEILWTESPKLYWYDSDYTSSKYGPGKWYHSEGPYNEYYRRYECLLFYINNVYREEMVFEIEYEMYNAVLRYNDCSDLYISMYSGDTAKYLKSFKGEILIPEKDMPAQGNYKITTYGTNAGSFQVAESSMENPGYYTFSFDLDEDDLKFRKYNNYIEFDLVSFGADKHIFAEHASINDYTYDNVLETIYEEQEEYTKDITKFKTIKFVLFVICVACATLVVFDGKKKIAELRASYPFYIPDAPENYQYRDIPSDLDPKFASDLVFCKDKKKPDNDASVYSALLLSLARKSYLDMQETAQSKDVFIKIDEDECLAELEDLETFAEIDPRKPFEPFEQHPPLTLCEKYYLDLLKRHATDRCITMNALQRRISTDYDYMYTFEENIKRSTINNGILLKYFLKADYQEPQRKLADVAKTSFIYGAITLFVNLATYQTRLDLMFGGLILLGLAFIAKGLYLKSQSHKYVLLTKKGEEEYRKWRGLYNFLKSDTLINERTFVELPLWEKYLVYATAFGISEKVINAIKIRCPEVVNTQSIVQNNYCRSGRIHIHSRSIHTSVRSSASHYRSMRSGSYGGGYSGGYSGGRSGGFSGGYGGGGRGGGGGGGGH